MEIKWTPRAKSDFNKVLKYLHENWSVKEVDYFINQTDDVLEGIVNNPQMFIESIKQKSVYKAFVTKHNSLFYKVKPRKKEIVLLVFWDNRQDPNKNIY
jgi:plasmid stabilization system protein ParE